MISLRMLLIKSVLFLCAPIDFTLLFSIGEKSSYSSFLAINRNARYTANEGPVRIEYKDLAPIYVFPEMKLCSLVISETEL
jgi:hypothetical protein